MIKNYFKTALRTHLKNKGTAIFNFTGLAQGNACMLTILTVVRYERSFDRFHR
jgi:putative ABC transport system permease protein